MAREALEIGGKLSCRVRGGSPLRTAALGPPGGRIQTRPENTVITSSDSGYQLPAPAVSLGAPMRQGGGSQSAQAGLPCSWSQRQPQRHQVASVPRCAQRAPDSTGQTPGARG